MPGTVVGGRKASETNKLKYGEDFYKKIGAIGGKKSQGGGFAYDREKAREAGRKGGKASRKKAIKQVEAETKHKEKLHKSWKERLGL